MSLIDADEPPLFDIGTTHEPDDDTGGDKGGADKPEGVTIPFDILEFGNGLLPDSALEKIGIGGHRLHRTAAAAFAQWRALAAGAGIDLTCTDSYRTLAQQKQLKQIKPTLSATPGRSVHGWGFAVDVSIGTPPKGFGQTVLAWLKQTGPTIGWHLGRPKDEPWHWVYRGDGTGASIRRQSTPDTIDRSDGGRRSAAGRQHPGGARIQRAAGTHRPRICSHSPPATTSTPPPMAPRRPSNRRTGCSSTGRSVRRHGPNLRSVTAPADRPTLAQGSSGDAVAWVQRRLGRTPDGDFGPKTNATVLSFQQAASLTADGSIGPKTWGALTT